MVDRLVRFLRKRCHFYKLESIPSICRDPKDDFLLELARVSDSDFLITGEKDLTDIKQYGRCSIITISDLNERIQLRN